MANTRTAQRPNIILVLVDDMGYSDLGCYGSGTSTPNLDALASNGLRFTDFYNTPRCCPSRASIMTGLTPHKAGVGWMNFNWQANVDPDADGYVGTLNQNSVTIAEALKPSGYRTYLSGKWHLSSDQPNKATWPVGRGFDRSFSCIAGTTDYFHPKYLVLDDKFYLPPEECYFTDLIGDYSVRFIEDHFESHAEDPFFMYIPFTAPHFPLQAPTDRVEACRARFDHGYEEENRQRYERMKELGVIDPQWELSPRPEGVPEWDNLPDDEKKRLSHIMEVYAAMVEIMDENVGKVVSALKKEEALDNTVIMFLSDNGACAEGGIPSKNEKIGVDWAYVQNTPFKLYKHNTMQGGVQTTFIAHWPDGITRDSGGIVNASTGSLYDIMPTCLDLASAPYPEVHNGQAIHPLDGQSLVPVLEGKELHTRRDIFIEHEGNEMLRRGDYKAVRQFEEPWQLYDMVSDRSESADLADREEHRTRFVRMTGDYQDWADSNHVISGERSRVYMKIHGYRSHKREQAMEEAANNAPSEDVIQG